MSETDTAWWRGAAIYQVYPRSFQDTDGDGVGDLPGITRRLDYIASLGVDAIWISPFYRSPMRDFGYDVADYRDVDPLFGTLADFDALIAAAHARGIKVIVDQVFAHTSDLHLWFTESRASRTGERADWYVWADAREDGTPPNNWQSVFGGPAWTWDGRRGQYYLHTFLKEQPQLNAHNPEVQEALLAVARFWLDRGVDGFRLDALNHAMHDRQLRDNPAAPDTGRVRTRPFDFQLKVHSQSQPEMLGFIERIRALCDEYGAIHTVAEVGGDQARTEMRDYTLGEKRLDSAYGFDFLYASELTPQFVAEVLGQWSDGDGWPTWAFENHDAPRAVSRWGAPEDADRLARLKLALLMALRGNVILYQGEELGLEQDEIPFELLQDPEAIANWPLTLSRDGVRTPMPWTAEGGFTSGIPWLPQGHANLARSVAVQDCAEDSILAETRRLIALRRDTPSLRWGGIENVVYEDAVLSFDRTHGSSRVRCIFNLAKTPGTCRMPRTSAKLLTAINDGQLDFLPGFSAIYVTLT